jgi:hypothetical protein
MFVERYTRVLLEASPEFPIHFLKIYKTVSRDSLGVFQIAHLLEQAARFFRVIWIGRSVGIVARHPRPCERSSG